MTNDDVYVELNDESGSWSVGSGLIECQVQQTNGGNLLVDRHFPAFPGQPFVSTWSTLANEDPAPVLVTDCQILNLDVPASQPLTLFHVEQLSWVYRRDFFSQKQVQLLQGKAPAEISMGSFPSRSWVPSSCAWFAVRDGLADRPEQTPHTGQGLVAGIEFNGKSRLQAWVAAGGRLPSVPGRPWGCDLDDRRRAGAGRHRAKPGPTVLGNDPAGPRMSMGSHLAFEGSAGFIRDQDIAQMHSAALRVLHEVGLEVDNETARQMLAAAGVHFDGKRAFFEPHFVEEQLDAIRKAWTVTSRAAARLAGAEPSEAGLESNAVRPGKLTIGVGDMCQYYHNPHTDAIELMSTAHVIEAAKCVQVMSARGMGSYVPGVPRDVLPQLQAILEYRIGAEFLPGNPTLDTLHPPEALPYLLEMSEAMGRPLTSGGMFTVSPLRLAGYEFDIAVQYADRWRNFWVTSYPAVGASAPVRMRAAWVMSIAECIGGAVTLHVVGQGKPVHFNVGMFPFDLHSLTIVGGMPECAWMYWASAQVNRFYDPDSGYSMMLSSQAKRPGLQAGMEKAIAGTFGVLTGCDDLHYAGVLSFDDIFSPEQMAADCELRDALERLAGGIQAEDPDGWVEEIRQGLTGGYVGTEATLAHYRETYWFPRTLDRTSWHTFRSTSANTARERARDEVLGRLARYDYRPASAIGEVRRIFARAWRDLGGDPAVPYLPLLNND